MYKGYSQEGQVAAIKKISEKDRRKTAMEAVRFLYLTDTIVHKNLVNVSGVHIKDDAMWIIMEYCDLGNLNDFFKNYGQTLLRSIEDKVVLMKQIANGVAFRHSKDVVHRDIKPGNVLLKLSPERHVVVKLGDIGMSKFLDPEATSTMSSNVGSLQFQAPEFWDKQPPDNSFRYRNNDVYSIGLTFVAKLQAEPGRELVPREEGSMDQAAIGTPIGLLVHIRMQNNFPTVKIVEDTAHDNEMTKQIKQVIRQMTEPEANNRLTASEVCSALPNLVRGRF